MRVLVNRGVARERVDGFSRRRRPACKTGIFVSSMQKQIALVKIDKVKENVVYRRYSQQMRRRIRPAVDSTFVVATEWKGAEVQFAFHLLSYYIRLGP